MKLSRRKLSIIYVIATGLAILVVLIDPFLLIKACASANYGGGFERSDTTINYTVPIDVVIVNTKTNVVSYSDSDIRTILSNANEYWQQANVAFMIRTIETREVSDELTQNLDSTDDSRIKNFGRAVLGDKFEDGVIDVIVFKSFKDGKWDIGRLTGKLRLLF